MSTANSRADGTFLIPAWSGSSCFTMYGSQPELVAYKPGYKVVRLINFQDANDHRDPSTDVSAGFDGGGTVFFLSTSRWDGATIKLVPDGDRLSNLRMYVEKLTAAVEVGREGSSPCFSDEVRPAFLAALEEERRIGAPFGSPGRPGISSIEEIFRMVRFPECGPMKDYVQGLADEADQDYLANLKKADQDLLAAVAAVPASTYTKPLAGPDVDFITGFRCPESIADSHQRYLDYLALNKWGMDHHPNWKPKDLVDFRYALLDLHDCAESLGRVQAKANSPEYAARYVTYSLLPPTHYTSDCIKIGTRDRPEMLPAQVLKLRDQARQDGQALTQLKTEALTPDHATDEFYLGNLYDPTTDLNATTVKKDWSEAEAWYLKAASVGLPEAEFAVADAYANGNGVPKDPQQAVHWYQLAAQHGYVNAAWDMGVAYDQGLGVERDADLARRWYCAAAMGYDPVAQWHMVATYLFGKAPGTADQAFYWLSTLSQRGNPPAVLLFGLLDADDKWSNSAEYLMPMPKREPDIGGYPTVEAARTTLFARNDVVSRTEDGWSIVTIAPQRTIWSFAPQGNPAYPSAVERIVADTVDHNGYVTMHVLCEASEEACDDMIREFQALDDKASRIYRDAVRAPWVP